MRRDIAASAAGSDPAGTPAARLSAVLRGAGAALVLFLVCVAGAGAQTIAGRVLERESGSAVMGAFIAVYDEDGVAASQGGFSDRSGAFTVRLARPGLYRVRVEALGFEPLERDSVVVGAGSAVSLELRLQQSPVELDPLEVRLRGLSLQDELTIRGARRRHTEAPNAGPSRVFMQGDAELRSANEVGDILRWVPPRSAPCTAWFVNGFKSSFPVADMPAGWFEAIEVYRNPDDVPAAFRTSDTFGCAVVAVWWGPGGSKLSLGRMLGLAGAVALALLLVR